MGKGRKLFGLALLMLALVEGTAWWLVRESGEGGKPDAARHAATATAPTLPEADSAPVLPVPTETADTRPLAAAPGAVVATPAPAEAEVAAAFTGRIVDESGRPVAGAVVRHFPSGWMRIKLGLRTDVLGPPLDLSRLARTETGADGGFSLQVTDHPPEAASVVHRDAWQGEDVPALLVMHPAFATRSFACAGWRGGPFEAGDISLVHGASVAGRAVDERGQPLVGVIVAPPGFGSDLVDGRSTEWSAVRTTVRAVTGDDGRFALDGQWPGAHTLELRADGRRAVPRSFELVAGRELDLGDIALVPGAVIEGFVLDAQGQPVPGAHVLVRPAELVRVIQDQGDITWQFGIRMGGGDSRLADVDASADEHGAFRFDSLDPSRAPFDVYAGAKGFETVRSDGVKPGAGPLLLTLPRVASIVLTVVDPTSHEPVAGAHVTARRKTGDHDEASAPMTVSSDPEALAAAGVAPPFVGVFLISPAGALRNTAIVSAPGRATQGFVLPEVGPAEQKSITVELPRASRLAGHVLDAARKPIADADVLLVLPKTLRVELEAQSTRTDADGRFAFDELQRGDWAVRASAPGFVTGETPPITVKKETAVEGIELVLQRAGAIDGVVLVGGQPLPGARVQAVTVAQAEARRAAERAGGGSVVEKYAPPLDKHHAVADEQGRFRFDDLPPEPFELTGPPGASLVADVKPGETTEVTLIAHSKPRIRGRVTDSHGPVAGVTISVEMFFDLFKSWASGYAGTRTDEQGHFELELEAGAGRWRVHAGNKGKAGGPWVELDLMWDEVRSVDLQVPDG